MDRNRLWNVLETYNFTGNVISAIKSTYKSMIIHIQILEEIVTNLIHINPFKSLYGKIAMAEAFRQRIGKGIGLYQGCGSSPNITIYKSIK
jgi:hypothetical protein